MNGESDHTAAGRQSGGVTWVAGSPLPRDRERSHRLHETASRRFGSLNWVAGSPLPRDRERSHRLHEPEHLLGTIDPISGHDVSVLHNPLYVVDGKLTIYFESGTTMLAFLNMPLDHPYEHSLGTPPDDADRGG